MAHYNLLYRWKDREQEEEEEEEDREPREAGHHSSELPTASSNPTSQCFSDDDVATFIELPNAENTSAPALQLPSPDVQIPRESLTIEIPGAASAEEDVQDAASQPMATRTRAVKPPGWLKDFVT